MQGIHATSDAPYVVARLGPKCAEEGAYVWQKLMKTGAVIANGNRLAAGDALKSEGEDLVLEASGPAEVLVFDL